MVLNPHKKIRLKRWRRWFFEIAIRPKLEIFPVNFRKFCSFSEKDGKKKILKQKMTLKSSSGKRGITENLHISQMAAFESKN